MKTNLGIVVCSIVLICASCTKQEIIPPEPDTPAMAVARSAIEKTTELLLSANWQIISYQKASIDRTDLFKGFDLTFKPNGSVVAAGNGLAYTGKYVVTYVDSVARVSTSFTSPASLVEISGDWRPVSGSEKKVTMQKVMATSDYLTIEKK